MEKTCHRLLGPPKTNANTYETKRITEAQHQPKPPGTQAKAYLLPAERTLQTHWIEPKLVGTADGPRPIDEETGFISP